MIRPIYIYTYVRYLLIFQSYINELSDALFTYILFCPNDPVNKVYLHAIPSHAIFLRNFRYLKASFNNDLFRDGICIFFNSIQSLVDVPLTHAQVAAHLETSKTFAAIQGSMKGPGRGTTKDSLNKSLPSMQILDIVATFYRILNTIAYFTCVFLRRADPA